MHIARGAATIKGARALFFPLVVAAVLILPPLYYPAVLVTSHEARFALLARDMLERGSWVPAERGVLYLNKPPLYPWAIATLGRLRGGVTEATTLVPVAVLAIAAVLFTALLAGRLFGGRAGPWAGLILATSYGFHAFTQRPVPDMLVVGFAAMASYAFWRAMEEQPGRGVLVGFYGAVALGVAAKGPVGLLPLLTGGIWLWTQRGARGLGRLWSPSGAALFLAITLSWGVPMLIVGSDRVGEEAQRELSNYFGLPNLKSLGGQVVRGLLGLLPWTLVTPLAFGAAIRARRTPAVSFALLSFVVPLVMISLSHIQRTRYLLVLYPGAALIVARWADADGMVRSAFRRVLGVVAALAAVVALTAPLWVRASPRSFVPDYAPESLPALVGLAVVGAACAWGLWQGRPSLLVHGVALGMALTLTVGTWLHHRWLARTRDYPAFAAEVARQAGSREAGLFVSQDSFAHLDFYLGWSPTPLASRDDLERFLGRPTRPVVVIDRARFVAVGGEAALGARVVAAVRVGSREFLIVRR